MPTFRKRSCQSISDVTVVGATNSPAHSRPPTTQNITRSAWQQVSSTTHNIRPISYDSSLPSSTTAGEGGRGRRKRRINPPSRTAKRGRGRHGGSSSSHSVFDDLMESYRERQSRNSTEREAKDSCIIHEIPDSPPPVPEAGREEGELRLSCSPSHSSSSSCDLTAIQLTSRMHENKKKTALTALTKVPALTTHTSSHTSHYWRDQEPTPDTLVHSSDILVSNEPQLKGLPPHSREGVTSISVDTEDDCLITETSSSLFRTSHTPSEVEERHPPSTPPPPLSTSSTEEDELLKLRKNMANFRHSTRLPSHLSSPSVPTHHTPPSPPPLNHIVKRRSLLREVVRLANDVTGYRTQRHRNSTTTTSRQSPSPPKLRKVCELSIIQHAIKYVYGTLEWFVITRSLCIFYCILLLCP